MIEPQSESSPPLRQEGPGLPAEHLPVRPWQAGILWQAGEL
jgi:hypothetical protein